jgi:hypothetical protein
MIERLAVRSTVFKDRGTRGEAAEWITIAPVDRAVAIAERLPPTTAVIVAKMNSGLFSMGTMKRQDMESRTSWPKSIGSALRSTSAMASQMSLSSSGGGASLVVYDLAVPTNAGLVYRQSAVRSGCWQDPV